MEFKKIKDCFPVIRNGATVKQDKSSGGIPITRIESINENKLDKDKLGYAGINDDTFKDFYLEDGDILMSHINSVSHLGKVAVFENRKDKIIHGMNLLCLKADKNSVIPNYAFYYFRNPLFINSLKKITKKSVNQASFNISSLGSLKFPLPEKIQDQHRIATILSKAEVLIDQRKQSIALLDEYLKSTFWDMFGDPVRNEKGWEKVPLNKFGAIITGNTPPRSDVNNFSGEYIEWIKTDNIEVENLFLTKAKEHLSEQGLKKSRFVEKEALLVACIAGSIESVGRANLTDRKVSFNQQINAIQPNKEINPFYLYFLFKNTKPYIQNHATKGMKKILTKGEFEKILMIKPPLTLQNQFAAIVQKVELLKRQYQQSLVQLQALFGSLSQRGFKGELNLKGNSDFKFSPALQRDIEVPGRIKIVKKNRSKDGTANEKKYEVHFNTPENIFQNEAGDTSAMKLDSKSITLAYKISKPFLGEELTYDLALKILKKDFAKEGYSFSSREFEQYLKQNSIQYDFVQLKKIFFELLEQKQLMQFYASKEWMKSTQNMQYSAHGGAEFTGDGSIWFLVPKNNAAK